MKSIKLCAAIGIAGLLAACAQQEEPAMITPEPIYNKYGSDGSGIGGGECVDGYIYVPGSVPQEDRCIPEEECEPEYTAATGQSIPCPPPRYPDRTTDGGGSDNSRQPTGGGRNAAGARN